MTAFTLSDLFVNLPQAVLAAIVIDAVRGFLRFDEVRRIASIRRDSLALAIFAMLAVLGLGMLAGLIVAIALNVVLLLFNASRPSVSVVGTEPVLTLRRDARLFFANARRIRTAALELTRNSTPRPREVVLDLQRSDTSDVDSAEMLAELRETLRTEHTLICGLRPSTIARPRCCARRLR